MTAVRVGVAGVGRLGAEHARILAGLPNCVLVGVADARADRAREVARRIGARVFDSAADLADACDALIVSVTTSEHHSVALTALEDGCHVLVEKPLTPTLAEADELIHAARRQGLYLAVGHVERFNGAIRACRPHLEDVRYLSSQRLAPFQPRGTDVPVILDLMIHDIDLVLGLVESRVASLDAIGVPVLTNSVDMANARIRFANGAVADISASRVSVERTRALRLFQPSGYFSLDLAGGRGEYLRKRPGMDPGSLWASHATEGISLDSLVERIPIHGDDQEPLRLELQAFLDRVGGLESASVSATEGREALAVALRIQSEIERSAYVPSQDSGGA